MLEALIAQIVDTSRRYAAQIVAATMAITVLCGWFAATHFAINTDVNQLLAADLPWRQQERAMEQAFPHKVDTLVAVIDGATPAIAEKAAADLATRLQRMPDHFTSVTRPDAIPFFRTNGLLFLPKESIAAILEPLAAAQPMIGTMVSDPSLRGFFDLIALMAEGVRHDPTQAATLDKPLSAIADTVVASLAGQDHPLPLHSLTSGNADAATPQLGQDTRKFILTKPVLDYTALSPGQAASDALRATAQDLRLTDDQGIKLRLTGPVALNDEEFASVADGTGFATILSGGLVCLLLILALRSLRIIAPIIVTLVAGLTITTAFALAAVGALNLISVAFAVMFIGIAVDFGIQFGVRYRDAHHTEPTHAKAMATTARLIAMPLTMAAGATALGFFAFIPTAYRGVSELGLIAGMGMLIAFFLNITLLPALLTLTKPPAEPESVGYRWAAPLDRLLITHRRRILIGALILGLAGAGLSTCLRFDFDPLNLKDPHTESVSTLLEIMRDPNATSYTIEMLRPTLATAQTLAKDLESLPEVDHAMTLASFVPDDQAAKMMMIADTQVLLQPTLKLARKSIPSDDDIYKSLTKAVAALQAVDSKTSPAARNLADTLNQALTEHKPQHLQHLHANIIATLQASLADIQTIMNLNPVTPDTISDDLRRDWMTADGRALIQVFPKGDPRDHATLIRFTKAVRAIAPDASGAPVSIVESGHTVIAAFTQAGLSAILAVTLLAMIMLRRIRDVVAMLAPLFLAGTLSLATLVVIGLPLNFANIIALPLLLSLGVSYAIYFVTYRRAGGDKPLQSNMARAVMFSAATVLVAFGSLTISSHPGTSGMGDLLTIALVYSVLTTFVVLPCLLMSPEKDKPILSS